MPRREALIIEAHRERFRFYYDVDDPEGLHISLAHGTSPDDAIDVFFSGDTAWNDERRRFQTMTPEYGLYWARHPHDQSVIVISCFKRGEM